jgi:hypothetical protein
MRPGDGESGRNDRPDASGISAYRLDSGDDEYDLLVGAARKLNPRTDDSSIALQEPDDDSRTDCYALVTK